MEKLPLLTRKKSYNRLVSTSLPFVWKDKNRPRKKYSSFRTNVRSIFDTSWDRFLHYIRNLCLLSRCTENFIKFERFDFYILDRGTMQFYVARSAQQSNLAARVIRNGVVNFKHFRFFLFGNDPSKKQVVMMRQQFIWVRWIRLLWCATQLDFLYRATLEKTTRWDMFLH